uniref:Uncharacterized protein n=1 Tax=Phytophthora ramorum TaxID=164328 RepID=H3H1B6_PHYRM
MCQQERQQQHGSARERPVLFFFFGLEELAPTARDCQQQLIPSSQSAGAHAEPLRAELKQETSSDWTMVTDTYLRKALAHMKAKYASLEDEHSLLKDKHSLLEKEHADMKTAHSTLQEEHAELHHERSDMEGEAWFWMVEKKGVQDEYKKLQDEHAQWKAACAALVKEVEHKQYGHTHWPVAKVAELEIEQERKLAEVHELAKEREQALTQKVAALESEVETLKTTSKRKVAKLNSVIKQLCAGIAKSRRSSKETTDRLDKKLAEDKAETKQYLKANKTLCSQMTATPTQQCCSWELELTETMERLQKMELKLSEETTAQSRTTSKSTATLPVALMNKHVKSTAPTQQQPEEAMSAAAKVRFGWASKTKTLAPSPSPTSSSPQLSRRSAA